MGSKVGSIIDSRISQRLKAPKYNQNHNMSIPIGVTVTYSPDTTLIGYVGYVGESAPVGAGSRYVP
jgi:hypothetical protein